jgi:hypothetical protein
VSSAACSVLGTQADGAHATADDRDELEVVDCRSTAAENGQNAVRSAARHIHRLKMHCCFAAFYIATHKFIAIL